MEKTQFRLAVIYFIDAQRCFFVTFSPQEEKWEKTQFQAAIIYFIDAKRCVFITFSPLEEKWEKLIFDWRLYTL